MARVIATLHRHTLWLIAALAVGAYVAIYATPLVDRDSPVVSDGLSYYVYLPSWVVYQDFSLGAVANRRFGGEFPGFSGLRRWPGTGRWVNPHPMGVAVLVLPFYVVGHALTRLLDYPAEGFSFFYRHSAGLAGAAYLVTGLFFLRRLLGRHFPPGVVLATLVCITFGTNLFHAGTFDCLWSHVYSFALIACLLDLADCWHDRPTTRQAVLVGFVVGLIALVRHANVVVAIFVVLHGVVDRASLASRARQFAARSPQLALAALVAAAVLTPQLALYRWATGSWFLDPYGQVAASQGGRAFDFLHPHLTAVLFSVRKGLFFWSPVLLLSVAGFFVMRGRIRGFRLPSIAVLAVTLYLIASWWDWQFGGSYGHRGFTDFLAVFALPMAALFQHAASRPKIRAIVGAFAVMAVALSIAQMLQYWVRIIPYSDVTWDQYRSFFLRFRR
jgi:hypothetical protein